MFRIWAKFTCSGDHSKGWGLFSLFRMLKTRGAKAVTITECWSWLKEDTFFWFRRLSILVAVKSLYIFKGSLVSLSSVWSFWMMRSTVLPWYLEWWDHWLACMHARLYSLAVSQSPLLVQAWWLIPFNFIIHSFSRSGIYEDDWSFSYNIAFQILVFAIVLIDYGLSRTVQSSAHPKLASGVDLHQRSTHRGIGLAGGDSSSATL